jgi:hypothetical protein
MEKNEAEPDKEPASKAGYLIGLAAGIKVYYKKLGEARIARNKEEVELYETTDFKAIGFTTVGKQEKWVKNETAELRLAAYKAEADHEEAVRIFNVLYTDWQKSKE